MSEREQRDTDRAAAYARALAEVVSPGRPPGDVEQAVLLERLREVQLRISAAGRPFHPGHSPGVGPHGQPSHHGKKGQGGGKGEGGGGGGGGSGNVSGPAPPEAAKQAAKEAQEVGKNLADVLLLQQQERDFARAADVKAARERSRWTEADRREEGFRAAREYLKRKYDAVQENSEHAYNAEAHLRIATYEGQSAVTYARRAADPVDPATLAGREITLKSAANKMRAADEYAQKARVRANEALKNASWAPADAKRAAEAATKAEAIHAEAKAAVAEARRTLTRWKKDASAAEKARKAALDKWHPPKDAPPLFAHGGAATAWFREHYPHLRVDLSDMHHGVVNEHAQELHRLSQEFPGTFRHGVKAVRMGFEGEFRTQQTMAHAYTHGEERGVIEFNPRYYGKAAGDRKLAEASLMSYESGFRSTSHVHGTLTHEFGHVLDAHIAHQRGEVGPGGGMYGGPGQPANVKGRHRELHEFFDKHKDAASSTYAKTDSFESFAESFAALQLRPRAQRTPHEVRLEKFLAEARAEGIL